MRVGRTARPDTGDAFGQVQSKTTVDQYAAGAIGGDTPLRSIEVGTEDVGAAAGASHVVFQRYAQWGAPYRLL